MSVSPLTAAQIGSAENEFLLPQHAALISASAIALDVATARGYRSITDPQEATIVGFSPSQISVPALLMPVWGVSGEIVTYQLRPDMPRVIKGKPLKYETPHGSRMALDIPPAVRHQMGNPSVPLIITEGVRKVDAAVSHGACCVALLGVWNWRGTNEQGGKTALPDWESIALNGRRVYIAFDSDVMTKSAVQGALLRLKDFLTHRGAKVIPLFLPPGIGGGKQGLDDYLAAGGTMDELTTFTTPVAASPNSASSRDAGDAWSAKIILLSDVKPERVRWLWPGYIPMGKLTVLDGDPGNGKSTLLCDLAARVSTGCNMPDDSVSDLDDPAGVVLLSAEDGPADTIRPRLDAAAADVTRIALLECAVSGERERGITLTDLSLIEAAIELVDARLVVIDPLMSFLESQTNSYRDQDMRAALAPLARLADRTGAAIVAIRHFTKGQTANVLYRGGGTIGIIGAARVGLVVAPDPDEPDSPRRVLAVAKSNLAMKPPAIAYRLTEAVNGVASVVWEGATHHTAAMLASAPPDDEERNAQTDAASVLREILTDGPRPADDVKAEAKRAGVSERTLWRAKGKLGVRSFKDGFGEGAVWKWELPPDATDEGRDRSVPKDAEGCQSKTMAPFAESGTLRGDGGSGLATSREKIAAYLRGIIAAHDVGERVPHELPSHIAQVISANPFTLPAVGARSAYGYARYWFHEHEGDTI